MFHLGQILKFDDKTDEYVYVDESSKVKFRKSSRTVVDAPMQSPWKVLDDYQNTFSELLDGISAFAQILVAIKTKDLELLDGLVKEYLPNGNEDLSLAIPGFNVYQMHYNPDTKTLYLVYGNKSVALATKTNDEWTIHELDAEWQNVVDSIITAALESLPSYSAISEFIDVLQTGATDTNSVFQGLSLSDKFDEAREIVSDLFGAFRDGGAIGLVSRISSLLTGFSKASYSNEKYLFEYPDYKTLSVLGFMKSAAQTVATAILDVLSLLFGRGREVIDKVIGKLSSTVPALKASQFTMSRNWSSTTLMLPIQSDGLIDIHDASTMGFIPNKVITAFDRVKRGQYIVQSMKTGDVVYGLNSEGKIMRALLPTLNYDLTVDDADYIVNINGINFDQYGLTLDVAYNANAAGVNIYQPLTNESSSSIATGLRNILFGTDDTVVFEPTLSDYKRMFSGMWILLTRGFEINDYSDPEEVEPILKIDDLRISCEARDMTPYYACLGIVGKTLRGLKTGSYSAENCFDELTRLVSHWKLLMNELASGQVLFMRYSLHSPNYSSYEIKVEDYISRVPGRFYLDSDDDATIFSVSHYCAGVNLPRSNLSSFLTNIIGVVFGIVAILLVTKSITAITRLVFRKKIKQIMRVRYLDIASTESALSQAITKQDSSLISSLSKQINTKIFKYNLLSRIFKYNRLGYIDGWISGGSGGWLNTAANITSTASNISSVGSNVQTVIDTTSTNTVKKIVEVGKLIKSDF